MKGIWEKIHLPEDGPGDWEILMFIITPADLWAVLPFADQTFRFRFTQGRVLGAVSLVTNFTVTKVIICFQLNLKTEKGCITLLFSKQPSSAHPSSHDVLQMTVSTVQCSNIREFWNFSFCDWKFGLLRRLNKIQRSFQKKNITKAHSIYHNCHLERNLKTKGEGVDQRLPLSVSTSMMGGGGERWTAKRNMPALQARINNDTQLDLCLALTWFEITRPITPWLVLNWVLLPFLI